MHWIRISTVAALLLSTGCFGVWVHTPGEIEELQASQDEMRHELEYLQNAMAENENLLRGLQAQSGTRTADLMERLSAIIDELDLALARLGTTSAAVPQDTAAGPGAQLIFDEAYRQFQQGSFEIAAAGFGEVLEDYRTSSLADDALYYKAICWEEAGQSHRAIEDLVAIYYLFPASEWAPGALFRAGDIYGAHGAGSERDRLFDLLLTSYPGSDEAALVREIHTP